MKKNSRISKMLGIGFLSMTTIFGGALISMHDVFATGGDGKDGDTHGTSQGTTDSSSDSVSISSYLQALYLDNESDEDDISRVGVDQYLDDSGYMNYDALDFNDSSFLNFENDSLNSLPFDVGDNSANSAEGQNPAPLPSSTPAVPISPQNTNLFVNNLEDTTLPNNAKRQCKRRLAKTYLPNNAKRQCKRRLAKTYLPNNAKRQCKRRLAKTYRPRVSLTDRGKEVKKIILRFGEAHGFIKSAKNCRIFPDFRLNSSFSIKVIEMAKHALGLPKLIRDEKRCPNLMYNNVGSTCFDNFMKLIFDGNFTHNCIETCKNDTDLLDKLKVTSDDIH